MTTTGPAGAAHVIPAGRLREFAERALGAAGMPSRHAAWTAQAMVWADLHDKPAHGVGGKLRQCVDRIRSGGTDAAASPRVVHDLGAALSIDGDNAWGQVAGTMAMQCAVDRARENGVGLVSVHNTSSAAAMGYYAWMAAEAGLIGIAVTNGPALIAAPEGVRRVVGNQGHAIACPGGDEGPFVYDAATTTMSTGAMDLLRERGSNLPEGVLRDSGGRPTRDPSDWVSGLLEPIGGHRGFGLSLAFEVLTGILSGGDRYGADVGLPIDLASRQYVSLLCMAVNPEVAVPLKEFRARLETYRRVVRESGDGAGSQPRFPGERALAAGRSRREDGVHVTSAKWRELQELAGSLDVGAP